ncbi:MAG TPA: MEDS domain-containing protein [Candidatus Nitrosotalea sp.]|nr:MEDS domain-containing protein [Candidatus Nitrosotalea sp.]
MMAQQGDHILGIYSKEKNEFDDVVSFLHEGIDNNEVLLLITDYVEKDEIRKKLGNAWNIDLKKLECSLDVVIRKPEEFYAPEGSIDALNLERFLEEFVHFAVNKGKSGIRIFGSHHVIMKNGLVTEMMHLESRFEKKFELPITALCAYMKEDIESLDKSQFETLKEHHLTIREM